MAEYLASFRRGAGSRLPRGQPARAHPRAVADRGQLFRVERHGDIGVITPAPEAAGGRKAISRDAVERVLAALRSEPAAGIVFDLSQLNSLSPALVSLLLRCHEQVKKRGGKVAIAGATERTRELLRLTALTTLWALYETRAEALAAVASSA
jgi:anti-anti-sigma factor